MSSPRTPSSQDGSDTKVVTFLKQRWLPLLLIVLAVVFVVQNTADTTINFLFLQWTSPLWFTLTICLLVGAAIGWAMKGRRTK